MLANYFPYPGIQIYPKTPAGMAGISMPKAGDWITTGSVLKAAVKAGCGYYIGLFFGHPIAGAILAPTLGLPGLFGLALFSDTPHTALPNRKRRRRRFASGGCK